LLHLPTKYSDRTRSATSSAPVARSRSRQATGTPLSG